MLDSAHCKCSSVFHQIPQNSNIRQGRINRSWISVLCSGSASKVVSLSWGWGFLLWFGFRACPFSPLCPSCVVLQRLQCSRWSTGLYCVAFLWSCCSWPALLPLFIEGKSERGKSSTCSCWNGSGVFGVRTVVNISSVGWKVFVSCNDLCPAPVASK